MDDKSKPFGPDDFKFTTNQIYTVYPDGSVELQSYITSNNAQVQLPRIGYAMELPKELNRFAYYGRGPGEQLPRPQDGTVRRSARRPRG